MVAELRLDPSILTPSLLHCTALQPLMLTLVSCLSIDAVPPVPPPHPRGSTFHCQSPVALPTLHSCPCGAPHRCCCSCEDRLGFWSPVDGCKGCSDGDEALWACPLCSSSTTELSLPLSSPRQTLILSGYPGAVESSMASIRNSEVLSYLGVITMRWLMFVKCSEILC